MSFNLVLFISIVALIGILIGAIFWTIKLGVAIVPAKDADPSFNSFRLFPWPKSKNQ